MELAVNVTIVGITVVFLVLIALTFIISLLGKLLNKNSAIETEQMNEDLDDYKLVEEESEYEVEAGASGIDTASNNQLIAVLTAAIAASINDSNASGFKVISFKRLPQPESLWNTVARNEQIRFK